MKKYSELLTLNLNKKRPRFTFLFAFITETYSKKADFKLFPQTFDGKPEGAKENFQMELIELQSNEFYNSKLGPIGISVIEFYKKYFSESKSFRKLIDPA